MQRFVLIDGHAILHRAYHAYPPLTTSSGELVNAVYGFTSMLFKVIGDLKPAYLAVTFDVGRPTFRQEEYLGYQAHRPQMDEELKGQITRVREIVRVLGIPIYEKKGFEADDVIGTLARKAVIDKKHKIGQVVVVTGDRDLFQLTTAKVKIYAPVKSFADSVLFGPREVKEKMGVNPDQIVDYKGLVGDSSDNYPGVSGIGPKTAVELLEKYKTFGNIYKHLDELPQKQAERLTQGEELGLLSQKLAQIVTNVPVKLDLRKCKFKLNLQEKEGVLRKFKELGFKSLVVKLESKPKKPKQKEKSSQRALF